MKIKTLPRKNAPQGQTIVIREQREGCFLQTLNAGCMVVLVVGALIAAAVFFTVNMSSDSPRGGSSAPQADSAPNPQELFTFNAVKDEMTDAANYVFSWRSEKSRERFSLSREALALRFKPSEVSRSTHKLKYEVECIIRADFAYVGDGKTDVAVRFDDNAAKEWKCSPSTTGTSLFVDDARGFLAELANARRVRVRFNDFGGERHDLDFHLGDFSLQKFREMIVNTVLLSKPPNVTIVD